MVGYLSNVILKNDKLKVNEVNQTPSYLFPEINSQWQKLTSLIFDCSQLDIH